MTRQRIEVRKPCTASWSAMTPIGEGRHCGSCNKNVIDFTSMEEEETKDYLQSNKQSNVCGRFNSNQVHAPYNNWQQKLLAAYVYADTQISYYLIKQSALLLLTGIMILSGCQSKTTGESTLSPPSDSLQKTSCDTTAQQPDTDDSLFLMGEIAPQEIIKK